MAKDNSERLVLTVEEAAILLHVSRPTAYKLAKQKQIPTITLGRKLFVPKSALLKFLESAADNCIKEPAECAV